MSDRKDHKNRLDHGAMFPFDALDSWWRNFQKEPAPAAKDWAHAAARGVIADLEDRHTIKHGFEHVDESVRTEIVDSLASIIRLAEATRSAGLGATPSGSETDS
jgi:hypothetical protein